MLTVHGTGTLNEWLRIEPQWTELVERCPRATPFQRPEWLLPWWRQFGSGELAVLAFRTRERLVGILPAFIHVWDGCRRVTLVGNGITDYLDLTAEPEYAGDCARLALEWFWRNRARWDLCDWQDLRADSPLLETQYDQLEAAAVPYLDGTLARIGPDAETYDAALPHGLRRTVRIATRRLERQGELSLETLRSDPDASALEALFRLHEERWRDRGGPESMLDSKATQSFLIAATRRLSARGMVRLYTMRFRDRISAVIYGILDRHCLYGYITGMDPELARFSPGSIVLSYAIRDAICDGAVVWDFLRGGEEYKFQWGAQIVPKRRLYMWHSSAFEPDVTGDGRRLEPAMN